jgi:hypothetical protein
MTHRFFKKMPAEKFDESNAPDWLTGCKTIVGSTMDSRWFWQDHVLTLKIGESVDTEFRRIVRIE